MKYSDIIEMSEDKLLHVLIQHKLGDFFSHDKEKKGLGNLKRSAAFEDCKKNMEEIMFVFLSNLRATAALQAIL